MALQAPDGQLTNSDALLYQVPPETEAVVLSGKLVNTSASSVTVQLYKKNSGATAVRITPVDLSLQPGDKYGVCGFTLEADGQIRGSASTTLVVDFSFSVHEQEEE